MTPTEAKSEVLDLYNATKGIVGGEWEIGTNAWDDCTTDGQPDHAMLNFGAQRSHQPLPDTPRALIEKVQQLWEKNGHHVEIVSDDTMVPPRLILSDPAWLNGSYPDGRLFQFTIGKDYADFDATGRCVPGDSYYLNTGKKFEY